MQDFGPPMSALGHKQTFARQTGMSALHPKADMCSALGNVCFGPKADIEMLAQLHTSVSLWTL